MPSLASLELRLSLLLLSGGVRASGMGVVVGAREGGGKNWNKVARIQSYPGLAKLMVDV